MQKSLKNVEKKNMKQPKRAQNPSKIIELYASQNYPNIYRLPEIGHTKKPLKIIQNQAKLLLAHLQVVWSVKGGHYPAGSLPGKINSQTERTSCINHRTVRSTFIVVGICIVKIKTLSFNHQVLRTIYTKSQIPAPHYSPSHEQLP
jgi:hypothetical protein